MPQRTSPATDTVLSDLLGGDPHGMRILGFFAHPDDEVFCAGGLLPLCADAGARTAVLSLTRGDAGQIREASVATRRSLASVRLRELEESTRALGVESLTCLDYGDGALSTLPRAELDAVADRALAEHDPDVVVTFGPDGATGHPDHVTSSQVMLDAVDRSARRPRVLHAAFPMQDHLMLDLLVSWLTTLPERFEGTAAHGRALQLFADGSSMLGFAADHLRIEWYPRGAYIIEQGEPAVDLFCILSGTVDIIVEDEEGGLRLKDSATAGSFLGQDGLAFRAPRNAHVVARDDVTCLVLSPKRPSGVEARGSTAVPDADQPALRLEGEPGRQDAAMWDLDVSAGLSRKVTALAAHRSQYAFEPALFPEQMLTTLLGTERFVLARAGDSPSR